MPDRLLPNVILASRLRMVAWVRWGMVADLILTGPGFALGPTSWSSASGYAIIHALPVPFPAWGWAWTVAAVLVVAGHWWKPAAAAGHGLACGVFGFWGICLAVPIVTGQVTGWGGPWHHLALAGLHAWLGAVAVYDHAYPARLDHAGTVTPTGHQHKHRGGERAWGKLRSSSQPSLRSSPPPAGR